MNVNSLSDIAAKYKVFKNTIRPHNHRLQLLNHLGFVVNDIKYAHFPNCISLFCPLRKKCTNHETAGDFRTEFGISPNLAVINNGVWCDGTGKNGSYKKIFGGQIVED